MTGYPQSYDSDQTIIRVDDNITEVGGEAINQLRDATFAMQHEVGLGLRGSLNSLAERLAVSINANGTLKQSALAAIGLVTLPIDNDQVGTNAGISESKLALSYGTSYLNTQIVSNKNLLDIAIGAFTETTSNFNTHLAGGQFLADGATSAHHVASHIDLNQVPSDPRDPFFTWTGLLDKNGSVRTADHVALALLQVNDDLVAHENATSDAHIASAITVETEEFQEIPQTANTVQKVLDYLDDSEVMNLGQHRAVQHANGIPRVARAPSQLSTDGYGTAVVPLTKVNTYRAHPPANAPVDSNLFGDDVVQFLPDNSDFIFDSQFTNVRPGDIVHLNYGNGIQTSFKVESKRFIPGTDWYVRLDGPNLSEVLSDTLDGYTDGYTDGYAYARIDRALQDSNTYGVLALAAANSIPSNLYPNLPGSLIVGSPKGASVLGIEFDGNKINATHYKLFLQLYPTGNPTDHIINLPAIDVTGNEGITPGAYTLEKIVQQTNNAFRALGYNYRFTAFEHEGNFGLMLADSIGGASFSIINSASGTYIGNVIGDFSDGFDGLGLGANKAGVASPAYQSSFSDSTAALTPTYVVTPSRSRNYIVNGQRLDKFAPTYLANDDGYWAGQIFAKVLTGSSVEVTYKIDLDLCAAGLQPGKTLVVQPDVEYSDENYVDNDYGRFIIKSVNFIGSCGDVSAYTTITVINGVHAVGNPTGFTSSANFPVRIYFSEDSVGFNDTNMISAAQAGGDYHRYHEIFVNDKGNTFSHERTRMPVQTESATLLGTAGWHVKGVSHKLKGYKVSATTEERSLRFYVLSFDSVTGEYDGYVGQRTPSLGGILVPGPVTTGRKNIVTRFYTESLNDYLDLEFTELSSGPGSSILSTTVPRYVDIEIFPTLRLDDELLLLGSCEVNWDPQSGQNVIQSVKSLRQFGSVDETDFTLSALDYIAAGDRELHENGVFRGYEFKGVASVSTGELLFQGGSALVNGRIVTSNAMSVVIPQISLGGATPSTVTWAVCVNMDGFLEPIVITNPGDQFFAGGAQYYVPSVTFAELVSSRKDLTPIALVDAAIASITINNSDVSDVRRFVLKAGAYQPIVVSGEGLQGSFSSLSTMLSWIKAYGFTGSAIKVRLRGQFTLTSALDLTSLGVPFEFEGDGAQITVNASNGLLVDQDITFRNISFVYDPTGTVYTAGDYVNRSNGLIFGDDANVNKANIVIESCTFDSSVSTTQRPPFIMMELAKGDTLDRLIVRDNIFADSGNAKDAAAVAVIGAVSGASTSPSVLANSIIENNIGKEKQGIYITTTSTVSGSGTTQARTFAAPGIRTQNVIIRSNVMTTIGFLTSGRDHLTSTADGYFVDSSLLVEGNTSLYIGILDAVGIGSVIATPSANIVVNYATGNVTITNNNCAWVRGVARDEAASDFYCNILITNNTLRAFTPEYLVARYGQIAANYNYGIHVVGLSTDKSSCIVSHNTLDKRKIGATDVYRYTIGIYVYRSCIISNNIIKGCASATQGGGIFIHPINGTGDVFLVQNNAIYRQGQEFGAFGGYIKNFSSSAVDSFADLSNNYFDSPYIDVANTLPWTIRNGNNLTAPSWWRVTGNKNHTKTAQIRAHQGLVTVQGGATAATPFLDQTAGVGSNARIDQAVITLYHYYESTGNFDVSCSWLVSLNTILPLGAVVIDVSCIAYGTDVAVTTDTGNLTLSDSVTSSSLGATALNSSGVTLQLTPTEGLFRITETSNTLVKIDLRARDASNDFTQTVEELYVTYREV